MLLPAKVVGFLDVAGAWDPSLMFVMGGAVPVFLVAWLWRRGRRTPLGPDVPATSSHAVDFRLVIGAALFGIGWGMTGVCPGPAVVNVAAPGAFTLSVFAAMLAGVALSFLPALRRRSVGGPSKETS
jgi:hypothetical protein